jgi:hypothetical protein
MPLQAGTHTLQGFPRSSDSIPASAPKQAIFVRLTPAMLDALAADPQRAEVAVEFGDASVSASTVMPSIPTHSVARQGFHVNDTFFPFSSSQEPVPHELYARQTQPGRPAQMRLHGSLKANLKLEGAPAASGVVSRLAAARAEEREAKEKRQVKLLDEPLLPVGGAAKKKAPKPVPAIRTADARLPPPAASSSAAAAEASSRKPSPLPRRTSPDGVVSASYRERLIKYLYTRPRAEEDIMAALGGRLVDDSAKTSLRAALHEVRLTVGCPTLLTTV